MEVYTQEITATCDESFEKDWRSSEGLYLVYPEVLFVGYSKTCSRPADLKGLCVVLEKSTRVWTVVQTPNSEGAGKSYKSGKVDW